MICSSLNLLFFMSAILLKDGLHCLHAGTAGREQVIRAFPANPDKTGRLLVSIFRGSIGLDEWNLGDRTSSLDIASISEFPGRISIGNSAVNDSPSAFRPNIRVDRFCQCGRGLGATFLRPSWTSVTGKIPVTDWCKRSCGWHPNLSRRGWEAAVLPLNYTRSA
jgi:hypothetical protein